MDTPSLKAEAAQAATELWDGFDENERAGVKLGMFPAKKMLDPAYRHVEGRLLAVALMDCAKADGGMIT